MSGIFEKLVFYFQYPFVWYALIVGVLIALCSSLLGEHGGTSFIPWNAVNIVGIPFHDFQKQFGLKEPVDCEKLLHEVKVSGLDIVE